MGWQPKQCMQVSDSQQLQPQELVRHAHRLSWTRLVLGLVGVFALFQAIATALGSDRGQTGVIVSLFVISATLAAERWVSGGTLLAAARSIGLGTPQLRGVAVSTAVCAGLLVTMALFVRATRTLVRFDSASLPLFAGLFAQAGMAEEALFRGYLFGRLRDRYPFWRACLASMVPFVAVHLWLFMTMPWPIAAASVVLAAITSVPFAHLYELGGRTIWAPALLHFTIQTVPKVFITGDGNAFTLPIAWMAASALVPLLVLLIRAPISTNGGGRPRPKA